MFLINSRIFCRIQLRKIIFLNNPLKIVNKNSMNRNNNNK